MLRRVHQLGSLGHFAIATLTAIAANLALFAYGVWQNKTLAYSYLLWNVFLAALPLLFAIRLAAVLRRKRWSDWEPIGWTLLWLLFLPNSFYMVSDYIHLRGVASDRILYVAVLFTSFIFLGLMLGTTSLYIVHRALRRRVRPLPSTILIVSLLLLCSFAIYIGRDLRWNSWDVIINPGGLLFDVSDRLLRPEAYGMMLTTMASFFVMLSSLYAVVWSGLNMLQLHRHGK